jgi:hypothetical protein
VGGFFSLSLHNVTRLHENTGMNWESTSFSESVCLTATHSFSLSVIGISRLSELSGMNSDSPGFSKSICRGASRSFSLSVVSISLLSGSYDLIEVLVTLAHSRILPSIKFQASRSGTIIQISPDASGSGLRSSTWNTTLLGKTDSASSGSRALALGTGLGVGLLSLILSVIGFIFWFSTRRKPAVLDFTEPVEFATTIDDDDDPWSEDARMVSGENVLASEPVMMDIPFTEPAMMEESLWVN